MTERDRKAAARKGAETRKKLGRRLPRSESAPPRPTLEPRRPRNGGEGPGAPS